MLNCHDATKLMSESQERPLALSEKIPLKFHTLMCAGCRNFDEQMKALRVMTRAYAKGKNEREEK
ncbi:MAG: anti-sigma factor family protein [Gallionella sp.]